MAISNHKAVNDKAKTSYAAIVQCQHNNKKKKSIMSVKLKLAQWESYPLLLKLRPKGETIQEQLEIRILFCFFINELQEGKNTSPSSVYCHSVIPSIKR